MADNANQEEKDEATHAEEGWFHLDIHPQVFFISAALIIFFVVATIVFQQYVGNVFQQMQNAISDYAGWLFIWAVNIVLIFILVLLAGRFGDIRLGGPDARPEFSTMGWFSINFLSSDSWLLTPHQTLERYL